MASDERPVLIRLPGEGEPIRKGVLAVTGEDSADRVTVLMPGDATFAPGELGPPSHRHPFEETFVVIDGEVTFVTDDGEAVVPAGGLVHVPGGAMHTFRNDGDVDARLMTIAVPSGIEHFMRELRDAVAGGEDVRSAQRRLITDQGPDREPPASVAGPEVADGDAHARGV